MHLGIRSYIYSSIHMYTWTYVQENAAAFVAAVKYKFRAADLRAYIIWVTNLNKG